MLGGSGDDLISSGDTVVESFIYGHEGHDEISIGDSITGLDTIKAGKGDDKINEPTYIYDMNGDVVASDSFGAKDNNESKWYGGEGNDKIWGAYGTLTGNQYYYGGNGDDQIFGANENTDGGIS